jgi:hypothetical protein
MGIIYKVGTHTDAVELNVERRLIHDSSQEGIMIPLQQTLLGYPEALQEIGKWSNRKTKVSKKSKSLLNSEIWCVMLSREPNQSKKIDESEAVWSRHRGGGGGGQQSVEDDTNI